MEAAQTASFLHPRRTLKENRNAWQDGGGSDVLVSGPLQWVPSCLCAAPSQVALGPPSSGSLHHVEFAGPGPFSSLLPPSCSGLSLLILSHLHADGIDISTAAQHIQLGLSIPIQMLSTSRC